MAFDLDKCFDPLLEPEVAPPLLYAESSSFPDNLIDRYFSQSRDFPCVVSEVDPLLDEESAPLLFKQGLEEAKEQLFVLRLRFSVEVKDCEED